MSSRGLAGSSCASGLKATGLTDWTAMVSCSDDAAAAVAVSSSRDEASSESECRGKSLEGGGMEGDVALAT